MSVVRSIVLAAVVGVSALAPLHNASGQSYPTKPIHLIVPYPAGGLNESMLRVVADQHGCPTYAGDLADALLRLAGAAPGIYHYCNDGVTTWHAFATEIVALAGLPVRVEPITTAEYPTPAKRPAYSVLDTSRIRALGIVPPPWRIGLARVVADALSVV